MSLEKPVLIEVRNLKMHFPVGSPGFGIGRPGNALKMKAVDARCPLSFIREGETLGMKCIFRLAPDLASAAGAL